MRPLKFFWSPVQLLMISTVVSDKMSIHITTLDEIGQEADDTVIGGFKPIVRHHTSSRYANAYEC